MSRTSTLQRGPSADPAPLRRVQWFGSREPSAGCRRNPSGYDPERGFVKIQERVSNDLGILRLTGRLTINDEPGLLKDAVAGLVRRGVRHVIIDLSEVRFIDSTRLGELIAAHVTLSREGGRLILAGTPPRILELLRLSSLADVFERFDTVEAATAALSSTAA
nr:MAG: hypothetical protein DIU54_00245 [Acidobacteriota bacterium]